MLKRFKRKTTALFLLLLLFTVGGCKSVAVHEELNDREDDGIVIRIAWWGGDERHELTRQVLELYSQMHPDIVFETLPSSWDDYFERLSLETAKGNMPDLVQMDYQYITTYSQNGSLADLTPFVEDGTIRIQDMEKRFLDSGVVDGRLTGIVLNTAILSMIYNPKVFDEAGLSGPRADWTWEDFADICIQIKEKTGKYGAAMTPILDLNLYRYWVRQQGEELFSPDQRALGYEDDAVYTGYMAMFRELMDAGAVPDPGTWEAINVQGQERLPVVTGEGGLMQEWNNFAVKVSQVNDSLKLVTPPLSESGESGLWLKPGMFFSIAETSQVKRECAQFIDWFLNSREANEILKGERGVPISGEMRKTLLMEESLPKAQREMFSFVEEAMKLCGDTPPPEPAGIEGLNEAFTQTANMYFYGVTSAEDAAAQFRRRANEILAGG